MLTRNLIKHNVSCYKSFYRLVAVAVVVAVGVITGSLAVGDSVRHTLKKRVEERLGNTETIIFSKYSYIDDSIVKKMEHSAPILLSNGFISISGKLIPVTVWGRDDLNIQKGYTKINQSLYDEIKTSQPQEIVLRLPSEGMIPAGSMFVTDTYTQSLRLTFDSVISVKQGGNINLKNEQTIPFNIFVNRAELAEILQVENKINLILSDKMITKDEFSAIWNYTMSGLTVETHNQTTTVKSNRIFIQDKIVETVYKNNELKDNQFINRFYYYLANAIRNKEKTIPYTFVTAVDYFNDYKLNIDEIIVSDYAAKRLNVKLNDTLSIRYFVSKSFKTLVEDSVFLKVVKIVSQKELLNDKTLTADFPGLSNVESCTDWNSDLPINMSLITKEDEEYWENFRNTPTAILPYSTMFNEWKNAFGSATALQIENPTHLNEVTFDMFDIQIIYPRETGMIAAQSGVDFSTLFLSLGIFIIIAAVLLMIVPFSEMLFRRQDEISLLKATGFSNKRILNLFWQESVPVVVVSAILGVLAGLGYTSLILFLLSTVWQGATHTYGFSLGINIINIITGLAFGVSLSLLTVYFCLKRNLINRKTFKVLSLNKRLDGI